MALVSLEDPGLTVFATHRLLKDLRPEAQEGIRDAAKANFELEEVGDEEIVPGADEPPVSFGYMDSHHMQPCRLRLNAAGEAALDEILADRSARLPPARRRRARGALPEARRRPAAR